MLERALPFFVLGSLPALATYDNSYLRTLRPIITGRLYNIGLMVLVICSIWLVGLPVRIRFSSSLAASIEPDLFLNIFCYVFIVPSVLADICFIAFFRWVLRKIAAFRSTGPIILCLIAVAVITALLIGPAVRFLLTPRVEMESWVFVLVYISLTNVVDAACLLLLALVMLLLLAHRLCWPLIKRPIYAANRKQLIKNSKLLGTLGTMLLLYAFPNNPVVKWITHLLPNLKEG